MRIWRASRKTRALGLGLFVLLAGFCGASAIGLDGLIGLAVVALVAVAAFAVADRMRGRRRR